MTGNGMKLSFCLVLAGALYGLPALGADIQAVTSPAGAPPRVVLTWPAQAGTTQLNLYRKSAGSALFPSQPLNLRPIMRLTDCASIKSVIPDGTEESLALAKALSDDGSTPFDLCRLGTITADSPKAARLQLLARAYWRIALVLGQGWEDTGVSSGTTYYYQLRGVSGPGTETGPIYSDVRVTAGTPEKLPPPTDLKATAGDAKVLLLWNDLKSAAGYNLYRATADSGDYQRVNASSFVTRINSDLDGKALATPSTGYIDFQRWDASGNAATHLVKGAEIEGPQNGVPYYYKVASVDLLGNEGDRSPAPVAATAVDKTPPAVPGGVQVTAVEPQSGLEVRWNTVEFDVDGHVEQKLLKGYRIYRYDQANDSRAPSTQVGGLFAPPPPGQLFLSYLDKDSQLRPAFSERVFYYRVEAVDASGNMSARSAAAAGNLRDITAPGSPIGTSAKGFDDGIRLKWDNNSEPDLDGYEVYRSLCANGKYIPCTKESKETPVNKSCGGPFSLIGSVSQADAASLASAGKPLFEDHTVPAEAPICYAYWIKALDHAQNKSGSWPLPGADERVVCERVRDRTPPTPAIISGLSARDSGVLVEWIGPPVQDIKAYHVYRSDQERGTYVWVGGMTVPTPASPATALTAPYVPSGNVGCGQIPLVAVEGMSVGAWRDAKAEAKRVYWYRVLGIDQNGNQAPLDAAAPASTFTFSTGQPAIPAITAVTTSASPRGLRIKWSPDFKSSRHRGFALFRSTAVAGPFLQVGSLIPGNEYQDNQVINGMEYWYRVVQMDTNGQLSPLSVPKSGRLTP